MARLVLLKDIAELAAAVEKVPRAVVLPLSPAAMNHSGCFAQAVLLERAFAAIVY